MARRIDTEAIIAWIRLNDQGGDPASPAATYKYLYVKSGGLYLVNSAGTVVGPLKTVATDTIWDTAGDIVYATGADAAQTLGIGTANQLLRTNAGATAPEWASVGRVLISELTPTTQTASFTGIPATYKHLVIEYVARSDKASVTSENMRVFLNNDTTLTNYRSARIYAYAAGTTGGDGGNDSNIDDPPAANATAGCCTRGVATLYYYAETTFNKQILGSASSRREASTVYEFRISAGVEWESAVAVNRVDFSLLAGNFVAGSTFRLYGVF